MSAGGASEHALGIDLGGTEIKLVAAGREGRILEQGRAPTADDSSGAWAAAIRDAVAGLGRRLGARPRWAGLAAPGLAARDGRSIAFMPGRLEGLQGLDWSDQLGLGRAVQVLNDAQAALLGELWLGAARGLRHAALLTLGTGVGGAILADGRLLLGHIGRAGHLGHLSLDPCGPLDCTGAPGSLEEAIGECSLERRSGGRFRSTRELLSAWRGGDSHAGGVWLRSVRALAAALASIANVLDPEAIILGGGVAGAGADLFAPLEDELARFEWRPGGHRVRIIPAALGPFAGALGAAWHAIRLESENTANQGP
jgi:glucokinase